ncbi:MAG TPA: PP2C family protein-serine/threonine phosphatase [Candidatus Limnocylindria bacterium]|nr:PP2C family protein-serine/threonine phosphatase [Candidatus Limnocylindria bacterium]
MSSTTFRRFLASQQIFLVAAVALFAVLKVINWEGAEFGPILIYSIVIGNLTSQAMERLAPFSDRFRSPYNWFVFVPLLFLVALAGSVVALLVTLAVYRAPLSQFRQQFATGGRLGVIMVMIVGCIIHLYHETRSKLERRNRELQRTVEDSKTETQEQKQEIGKAREIQEGLLPKRIPQLRGLEIAGVWQPARAIGGDFYDVVKFNERKMGVCIGDVVGKGISAALLMANLQASFRAFTSEAISPGTLVGRMNGVLCNNIAADKFVTFCYCTIDVAKGRLTYAGAGHWPPILLRRTGEAMVLRDGGPPLGIFPGGEYEDIGVDLESGDQVVFYTDGLTEATNSEGQEFGERRVIELGIQNLRLSAEHLLQKIVKEVTRFSVGNFQDDLTMVVVSVK